MLQYEDDLLCDLAEYYGIYDLEALPVKTLAGLSCGLPPESRTVMRMTGQKLPLNTLLLAAIADRLGLLCWQNTKAGQRGRNRPDSILSELLKEKEPRDYEVFTDGEEFLSAWNNLAKEGT